MKKCLLILASVLLLTSCAKQSKNVLHVYCWADYISEDVVKQFEKENNCQVTFDYYDSNEAMYAKLKAGCTGYDLLFPSTYMADIMNNQNMLLKLNLSKIPNIKYVDKTYSDKTKDKDFSYSVPYTVAFSGIAYNTKLVPDIKPTWGMFGKKKYSHRMSMFDDMREAIGAALKYLGYSLNTANDKELEEAKDLMLKWKKNLAAYLVDEAVTSLGSGALLLIQTYNGYGYLLKQDNPDIGFIVPEEGTSIGADTVVIPKDAEDIDLAYKFIDLLCKPESAVKNMEAFGLICPNTKAYKMVDQNLYDSLMIPKKILDKSEVIQDLGADNKKYVEIWDEIKATNV